MEFMCLLYLLLGVFLAILVSFGSEILNIYIFVQFRYIFQVSFLEKEISDFNKKWAYLLFSETDAKVLNAIEDLSVKIMIHEHRYRTCNLLNFTCLDPH